MSWNHVAAFWCFAFLAAFILFGCASAPPTVLGHCEIPQAYDYVAQEPAPLPPLTPETVLKGIAADDAQQRGDLTKLAHDHNGFVLYVKVMCN